MATDPNKAALERSRDAVRAALRAARGSGDRALVLELRRLDVAAESLLRARGPLPERHALHYWEQLGRVVKTRPELKYTLARAVEQGEALDREPRN